MTKSVLLGEGLLAAAIFVYDAIMQVLLGLIVSLPQLPDGCIGREDRPGHDLESYRVIQHDLFQLHDREFDRRWPVIGSQGRLAWVLLHIDM